MTGLRRLLLDHRARSAWLVACALLMKILVPAGFMPVVSNGALGIAICSGSGPAKMTMPMTTPGAMHEAMPGMAHHPDKPDHQSREMPCAFSGLSMASIAATDPPLLATAIAFVIGLGFRAASTVRAVAPAYLKPPSHGPPALA